MSTYYNTYPNQRYVVFNTIQASAADLVFDDGEIYLGDPLERLCEVREVVHYDSDAAVAEQLQETTLTPTAGNNQTYEIYITQWNPVTGRTMEFQFSHETAASGATATTISTAFKDAVNAATALGQLEIDATGTTTIVLDALAGYAIFNVTILQTGGGFTQATGTAGIAASGTAAALALQGITDGITAAASYTTIVISYQPITGQNITERVGNLQVLTVYLNEAASNFSTLAAAFNYLFASRTTSIGDPAVNPEFTAIPGTVAP